MENSELQYRRLFETAQDGILILDAGSGQITDANPFLLDMLGYTREQLLGRRLWKIGLFKDRALSESTFAALHEEGYVRYERMPLETKDGRQREVEFTSNLYEVNHQKVIQCNIRDITDRRRLEDALREADRRKDEFLATLAHELRNPLAPFGPLRNPLPARPADRPWQTGTMMERQVQHLVRLVDDLLDVSRVMRGKINCARSRWTSPPWWSGRRKRPPAD